MPDYTFNIPDLQSVDHIAARQYIDKIILKNSGSTLLETKNGNMITIKVDFQNDTDYTCFLVDLQKLLGSK